MTRPGIAPSLVTLAWINVFLHVVGLVLAAIGMQPGSPLVPLDERLSYLAAVPFGWTAGWVAWMACALALIAFVVGLTSQLDDDRRARLALVIALVGLGLDLFCDSVYLLVFPEVASRGPALFLTVERITGIGSLVIANGAYSVSILLITLALQKRRPSRWTTWTGYAVAGFGLLLSAAGFTGVPWHVQWATLPTIGFFCVWAVLAAYSVEPAGEAP